MINYTTGKILKSAEEDIYSDGCQPGECAGGRLDLEFSASSVPELIEKTREYLDAKKVNVMINSCGEAGRVDIQVMETADGTTASPGEIARWKRAEIRLWLACYTFYIERVESKVVDLKREKLDTEYAKGD